MASALKHPRCAKEGNRGQAWGSRTGGILFTSVAVAKDGKSVFLAVKGLQPVMQMRIGYDLRGTDGKRLTGAVYNTIHKLAPAEKR